MRLYIPRDREAHNTLVAGANGTRKSRILRDFADQAIARGWPCVFTDPFKRAYVAEYYRPGIDFLVNCGDARCVEWELHREFSSPVEAEALARAIVVSRENSVPYYVDGARDILAFLLGQRKLRLPELLKACADASALTAALQGSGLERLLSGSKEQCYGFLNNVGNALGPFKLLPHGEGYRKFCIKDWCEARKERKGHIFFASSSGDFDAQQRLQALMIDMLLAGMQRCPGPGCCIFDEIGVFGEIPKYADAMSINRSAGNPIISAFQSFGQLRQHYGRERTDIICTGPYTVIILALASPADANYASDLLGLPSELERIRESRDANMMRQHPSHSYSTERTMVSAVTGGEIQSLEDGHGYVGQRGKVTKFYVEYRPAKKNQPDLIPREWGEWKPQVAPSPTTAVPTPEKPIRKPRPRKKPETLPEDCPTMDWGEIAP
jgi:Type IV secretion-system coupling protein DNA-binding domain